MLDSVAGGNSVDFSYKGQQMRIVTETGTSKLARLRPQKYTLVSEREMEADSAKMSEELQADWLVKWDK